MPTQEQIERVADAIQDVVDDRPFEACGRAMSEDIARRALRAARPTPDEHERGIEAATVAHRASTGDTLAAMRAAIAAYLAATGGGNV